MQKIAIISDLHCGKGSIAKDFSVGETANAVISDFLGDFETFVQREGIAADYLLVSGDITHGADEREFELAEERILRCAEILCVEKDKIIVIPGNHDGSWDAEKKALDENLEPEAILKRKYKNFRSLSMNISQQGKSSYGHLTEAPWFSVHELCPFVFIAINSAAHDSVSATIHHGSLCSKTLNELDSWLTCNKERLKDKCLVFLLHHHPIQYPDYPYEDADLSILNNAAQLMNLATNHDVGLIVHGHKHIPQIKLHIDEVMQPVNIVCAGSFSSRLDDRWLQGQGNFFHIVNITLDDVKAPKGKLLSWARYSGHGWIDWQQRKLVGVSHVENFGNSLSFNALKEKLRTILTEMFALKCHARWEDIVKIENNFSYCPSRLIEKIVQSLEKEIGFETHIIQDGHSFVFIKEDE